MTRYKVRWTETNRREVSIEAPGVAEAREAFWNLYHDLNSARFPIGELIETSEPQEVDVAEPTRWGLH